MCAFYYNQCKQIWGFCWWCCKTSPSKIYNASHSLPETSQDQQIEHAVNVFAALSKEKDDFNARKMQKVLHEIRNFRTLDDTTIKCIRRLNDADKMRIILAFNDVVDSMQLIFESLLN